MVWFRLGNIEKFKLYWQDLITFRPKFIQTCLMNIQKYLTKNRLNLTTIYSKNIYHNELPIFRNLFQWLNLEEQLFFIWIVFFNIPGSLWVSFRLLGVLASVFNFNIEYIIFWGYVKVKFLNNFLVCGYLHVGIFQSIFYILYNFKYCVIFILV